MQILHGQTKSLPVIVSVLLLLLLLFVGLLAPANAQQCPSGSRLCRETAPLGALLHKKNSKGQLVWTTTCGPNTDVDGADNICLQISNCATAGGFGKFLQAVTFGCATKHFDGYFGLDGMTFGILDWTSDNLPPMLKLYRDRNPARYDEIFGKLGVPVHDGCADPNWVCENNQKGNLMCDAGFHSAFSTAVKTADFRKAEIDLALTQYEARLKRFHDLGLKTEFGNTAMAVLANNLLASPACQPATWKRICSGQIDETRMVDCMLDQYAKNSCRGGSQQTSQDRVTAIKAVFASAPTSENIHPTADAVTSCSTNWGD